MNRPLQRGDIVLVPFPFTDLTVAKVRPALIVSPDPQGRDVVLAFISSVRPDPMEASDFEIEEAKAKLIGLKKASYIRLGKIATLERECIQRRLGRLQDMNEADRCLSRALGLDKA